MSVSVGDKNGQTGKSCWTCVHQQLGGGMFHGRCRFPAKNNPDRNKRIPVKIADVGCSHWARAAGLNSKRRK